MQYIRHTYTKKLFTDYLKLKCNWAPCSVCAKFGNPCFLTHFTIHSPSDGHTGCLCLITIANDNTTNVPICAYKGTGKQKVFSQNDYTSSHDHQKILGITNFSIFPSGINWVIWYFLKVFRWCYHWNDIPSSKHQWWVMPPLSDIKFPWGKFCILHLFHWIRCFWALYFVPSVDLSPTSPITLYYLN